MNEPKKGLAPGPNLDLHILLGRIIFRRDRAWRFRIRHGDCMFFGKPCVRKTSETSIDAQLWPGAHSSRQSACVGPLIKAEPEMDTRLIFSALAGAVLAATIFATITTVRYISHRSDTSVSRPSGLDTPAN
jgi:hypothetical protein